jgi:nickel/cobalt exporter
LHALEPGHAKTLTAAYLIGIKGTKRDAFFLGLSVALTHSLVVILIAVTALYLGRETFTEDVTHYLQVGSGAVVVLLGAWMMLRRYRASKRRKLLSKGSKAEPVFFQGRLLTGKLEVVKTPDGDRLKLSSLAPHSGGTIKVFIQRNTEIEIQEMKALGNRIYLSELNIATPFDFPGEIELTTSGDREVIPFEMHRDHHSHDHHSHDHHSHDHHSHDHHSHNHHDDHGHVHEIPDYVKQGHRPTLWQIFTFGAAGGMIPCPASVTVMLLALSVGQVGMGLFTVMGFSLGLALTLVAVGLVVVAGISKIQHSGRFNWLSENAPILSAGVVMASGVAALLFH